MKTLDFLAAVRGRYEVQSDYGLAKVLETSRQVISRYVNGGTMDDEMAVRVAEKLSLPPAYVLACIAEERAERTKRPEVRAAWHEAVRRLAPAFAAGFILIGSAISAPRADASGYTLCEVLHRPRKPRLHLPR